MAHRYVTPSSHKQLACLVIGQLLFFLQFFSSLAFSAPAVKLDHSVVNIPLGLHFDILEDPGKQWTIEQVSGSPLADQFIPSQWQFPGFGYSTSAYWLRVRLTSDMPDISHWVLANTASRMDSIKMYIPRLEGGFDVKEGGDRFPFDSRDISYHKFAFNIVLQKFFDDFIYIRVDSTFSGISGSGFFAV